MVRTEKSIPVEKPVLVEWDCKHPLADPWSFWYFNRTLSPKWEECLKEIGSFSTVEDFWCYFHHMQLPSFMKTGCDLCIFKKGIIPMWEDPANKRGGRWEINLDKATFSCNLDDFWMKLAMDLIGCRFGELDSLITGAIVSKRDKVSKLALWTNTSNNEGGRLMILGRMLKGAIGLSSNFKLIFRSHEDCSSNKSLQQVRLRV